MPSALLAGTAAAVAAAIIAEAATVAWCIAIATHFLDLTNGRRCCGHVRAGIAGCRIGLPRGCAADEESSSKSSRYNEITHGDLPV